MFCRTWLSNRDSFASGKTSPRLELFDLTFSIYESHSWDGERWHCCFLRCSTNLKMHFLFLFFSFSFSPSFNGLIKILFRINMCNCPVTFARSPSEHRKLGKHFSQGNWWFVVLVLFLQGEVTYGKSCYFRVKQSYSSCEPNSLWGALSCMLVNLALPLQWETFPVFKCVTYL